MKDPLLSGPESLRDAGERRGMIVCIFMLPVSIGIIGALLSEALTPSRLLLIAIGALLYVSISRGRLLGDSIHVHAGQLPHVANLVAECARILDVSNPQVFIRDDVNVPIAAVGVAEPYALVISSHWLQHLQDEELKYLIARELAHIRAGHTRISSVLSVNGRENTPVSVVFGAYLRRTEYTADRIALCACGSLESAIMAIAIASFHHLGRKVDLGVVADQLRELRLEPTLRAGEWLGSSPYAARRIAGLLQFASTPLAQTWLSRFRAGPIALPRQHAETTSRRVFAGWWRRTAAWIIDFAVVTMVLSQFPQITQVTENGKQLGLEEAFKFMPQLMAGLLFSRSLFYLWIYAIILVAVVGRTIGMMIMDLRVVRTDLERPTIWNTIARYVLAAASLVFVFPILIWGLRRVQPYDRLSGTRLVSASVQLEAQPALTR
ncbi:MAG TPA: RDD family protein [Candidatus Acidoferrales bacterium]|nr:RDD family protein [Candidatus Acidoferrales bacterium]